MKLLILTTYPTKIFIINHIAYSFDKIITQEYKNIFYGGYYILLAIIQKKQTVRKKPSSQLIYRSSLIFDIQVFMPIITFL